jgi:mannan endo-1,4-beta-mannosidase
MHSLRKSFSIVALTIGSIAGMAGAAAAMAPDGASTATTSGSAGVASLSASTYSVAQNAGSVTLVVNRTGGASGAASVRYATANGTAAAGTNYTTEHGRFSWANGDDSPRALIIPISNSAPFTGTKTLAVAIASAEGLTLGAVTSAIVTIHGGGSSAPTVSLSATPASISSGGSATLVWSTNNASSCAASGGWSGSMSTRGSQSIEDITATKTYTLACSGAGGSASQSATVAVTSGSPTGGTVSRPAYNTGNGFFVLNGELYDANGNEFRFRGVDRNHYDSNSAAGIAKSHSNAVRIFVESNFGVSATALANIVQTQHINEKEVPIPTSPVTPSGTATNGSNDPNVLNEVVSNWVSSASSWTPLNKYIIVNLANEWGPANSTVWRDSYISAIAKMRAAGYLGTLLIDTGGWGQDINDLKNYSTAVFNSDPQKNVMFALHVYNSYNDQATLNSDLGELAALSKSVGMVFAATEFGPGRGIGVSSALTPGQIITTADANGFGWLAWAWDADCGLGNNGFGMTFNCGVYNQPSDLTIYGQDVVLNPTYGIAARAKPASIF